MTPGPDLDIGQARRKAILCARGAGNLILWLTPVTFEIRNNNKYIIVSNADLLLWRSFQSFIIYFDASLK